jgi:hypothetical protein
MKTITQRSSVIFRALQIPRRSWCRLQPRTAVALLVCAAGFSLSAEAQPALSWSTNVNARLFSVDAQQNAYATFNGQIVRISGAGAALTTNAVCPLPSVAQRDSQGNFLFAGNFDGTQDFGGITLVGGWTNWPSPGNWTPNWPTCFLAKYDSSGSLLWVTSFGMQSYSNRLHDIAVGPGDSIVAGFDSSGTPTLAGFSGSGTHLWETILPVSFPGECRTLKTGGGYFLSYTYDPMFRAGSHDATGNLVYLPSEGFRLQFSDLSLNAKPAAGISGEAFVAYRSEAAGYPPMLQKFVAGSTAWTIPLGEVEQWTLGTDSQGNVFLAGTDGTFSKRDRDGALLWSANYGSPIVVLVVDSQDRMWVELANGEIGRLAAGGSPDSPLLGAPGFTAQGFSFRIQGDAPAYAVFATTNLTDWSEAGTFSNSGGGVTFVDESATNTAVRLYRVEALP